MTYVSRVLSLTVLDTTVKHTDDHFPTQIVWSGHDPYVYFGIQL